MRAIVLWLFPAIIPALLLCGCTRDPYVSTAAAVPSGNWKIERQADRITGKPINSAFVTTRTSSNSAVAFTQPATLQLACFLGKPVVKFSFMFKIGSNQTSFLGYRFDEKPGHEIGGRFLQDYTAVVIDDGAEVAQFVGELSTSSSVYVRIRSLNAGRTTAEFKLDGAPAAVEAAFAGCPVTGRSAGPLKRRPAT